MSTFEIITFVDMFKRKGDHVFRDQSQEIGIAYGLLVVEFDGNDADHKMNLWKVLDICKEEMM